MNDRHSGVGKAIAKGAAWTLSMRLVNRGIGIVSTLILARLLSPEDFGVYALAMSVYAFIELLRAFGFSTALIQNQQAVDDHYHTAWTLHLLFSILAGGLLFLSAAPAAEFVREPKLEMVFRFMSLLFFLDGLKNVGIIDFQKYMTFDREFRMRLITKLAGFFVTVPLAFVLRSYWALLAGLMASSLALVLLSYTMQPFRPRLHLGRWRELLAFSAWLQVNNFLNYFNRHVENFMLSRMAGTAVVGSLRMARETGQLLAEVAQPINRAAFPGYARVNRDMAQLGDVFCDVMSVLMVAALPIALGTFAIAHLFVPTVLGETWLHIVPLVRWLALAALLSLLMSSTNNVLIAMGRVRWASAIIAVRLVLFVSALTVLLPRYGVIGVPFAALATFSLVLMFSWQALRKSLGLTLGRVARLAIRPLCAGLVMVFALQNWFPVHLAQSSLPAQLGQLAGAVVTGVAVYILVVNLLWCIQGRPESAELKIWRLLHSRTGLGGFMLPGGGRED